MTKVIAIYQGGYLKNIQVFARPYGNEFMSYMRVSGELSTPVPVLVEDMDYQTRYLRSRTWAVFGTPEEAVDFAETQCRKYFKSYK